MSKTYKITGSDAVRIAQRENLTEGVEPCWNEAPENPELLCGTQIQVDRSGQGHAWQNIDARDIPHAVREEIEGEILDGGKEEVDEFVASNGARYRW